MDVVVLVLLLAVSTLAGILGSILGLGGGFIITPTLIMLNLEPYRVSATSLFTVVSTSLSSSISYAKQGRIDYRLVSRLALSALPGAIIGAYIASIIDTEGFKLYFAMILASVSIYMLLRPYRKNDVGSDNKADDKNGNNYNYNNDDDNDNEGNNNDRDNNNKSSSSYVNSNKVGKSIPVYYTIASLSGLVSSLFGIGGGAILVPMMLILMGMSMHRAVPNAQFIILVSSIVGLLSHAILGHPDYMIASILVVGTFIGAQIGARLLGRVKDIVLRRAVSIALLGIAVKFFYDLISSG
jgi:uncharacterized membrane protein YfcA